MPTIRTTWIDSVSPGVLGTRVYRDDIEIADVANGVQLWDDTTALDDTTYKYEVQAYTSSGESTDEVIGVNVENITTSGSFDIDYQAWLDRSTVLGGSLPSPVQQTIQNQLVLDVKSNNIWNLLDVFYLPANDGSDILSTLNLINPLLNQFTKIGTVGWTSNQGYKASNDTSCINTNYNPTNGTNFIQSEASMFLYTFANDTKSGFRVLAGANTGGDNKLQLYRSTDNLGFFINRDVFTESLEGTNLGLVHINRPSNSNIKLFSGGVEQSGQILSASAIANNNIYIGGQNNLGTLSHPSDVEWGVFGVGGDLEAKAVILNTLITNYMNAI